LIVPLASTEVAATKEGGMARKITRDFTFDQCEDEVIFTSSAIMADPDAAELREAIGGWLGLVDAARAKDREARIAAGQASATRVVANGRLDDACQTFSDELNLAVKKERASARFARFFPQTISGFVSSGWRPRSQRSGRGWA
jgi:hypothetical protein